MEPSGVDARVWLSYHNSLAQDVHVLPMFANILKHDTNIGNISGVYIGDYNPAEHSTFVDIVTRVAHSDSWLCREFDPSCLARPCKHLVLVSTVYIRTDYRKNGYGLDAMNSLAEYFRLNYPGTAILLYPAPMGSSSDYAAAKLRGYWKKCGFARCKKTHCFFRECDA